jgi:hypothetical protein
LDVDERDGCRPTTGASRTRTMGRCFQPDLDIDVPLNIAVTDGGAYLAA